MELRISGASWSSLYSGLCGLFSPVAGFHIYIYICPSSAIDRALVSGMSVYVNIFYLYGAPVTFMLQEATQPTAEQKKAGDPEERLKGRRPEWKFRLFQKNRKHYAHILTFCVQYLLFTKQRSSSLSCCSKRIRAKPATSKAKPPV